MIKAYRIHLSMNMWEDWQVDYFTSDYLRHRIFSPDFRTEEPVWDRTVKALADGGNNMIVIDLGDAVQYKSHPEIAVNGAWSTAKLREKLQQCRDLGLEVIPKMNFSCCHSAWLKEYRPLVGTPKYHQVCSDLITEAIELFDGPRFFHIGMDEETFDHQTFFRLALVRQGRMWWEDLAFYLDEISRQNVRPWMWADVIWRQGEELFTQYISKNVVQSNWYYDKNFNPDNHFDPNHIYLTGYTMLSKLGYDQIPASSNWQCRESYGATVEYALKNIPKEHLLGFLNTCWYQTCEAQEHHIKEAIALMNEAHRKNGI